MTFNPKQKGKKEPLLPFKKYRLIKEISILNAKTTCRSKIDESGITFDMASNFDTPGFIRQVHYLLDLVLRINSTDKITL